MPYKTIPLKPETYRKLLGLKRALRDKRDKAVSWDDVINYLLRGVITLEPYNVITLEDYNVVRGPMEPQAREVAPKLPSEVPSAVASELPSYFQDNPWLEILARRGQE